MEYQDSMQHGETRGGVWARFALMAAVFLLPIVVVPVSWFPFDLTKLGVFSALLALSVVFLAVSVIREGTFAFPKSIALWAVVLLPVVYAISASFSQNKGFSYIGTGTEVDTLFFVAVCAAVAFVVTAVNTSRKAITNVLHVLLAALLLVGLFQCLQLFYGPGVFGLSAFSTLTTNLIGKWNDFGLVMGLLGVLSVALFDLTKPSPRFLPLYILGIVISLFTVAVVNLNSTWQLLLGASVIIALVTFFSRVEKPADGFSPVPARRAIPLASIAVFVISVIFVVWGSTINVWLSNALSLSALEVRPSTQATLQIAKATYAQSTKAFFIGTGPSTFIEQWLLNKPAEVNVSQFWSLDFISGSGVVPTAFITTGVVGGVAWLLIVLALLFLLIKTAVRPTQDAGMRGLALTATIGALFMMGALVLYTANQTITLVAFTLIGLSVASVALLEGRMRHFALRRVEGMPAGVATKGMGYALLLLVVAVPLATGGIALSRLTANYFIGTALAAANGGDLAAAFAATQKALSINRNDATLRLAANIKASEARNIFSQEGALTQERTEAFSNAYRSALEYAQAASTEYPRNYQNWLMNAQLFEALIPLKFDGAYQSAKGSYTEAIARNPKNPGIYLSAARMEAAAGNEQGVIDAIRQAISIKPNYTEAALFIVQLEVARNNIDGAIEAATAAVNTAPDNAGIWFQLGLLYYVKGNADLSIEALSQAIKIVPDYANAKYFLGLALVRKGQSADAIPLFEDLVRNNPDNAEVKLILNNLRAGKDPFDGAQPPVTPNPEKRTEPPIEE